MDKILPQLSSLVKGASHFSFIRAGHLYYTLTYVDTTDGHIKSKMFRFSIPISDIGGATLSVVEKSITLMRWIRKAYENKELIEIK